jgi:cytochrome c biogenesis protein CcmG, thiol:disulfide interchange protein DsbE
LNAAAKARTRLCVLLVAFILPGTCVAAAGAAAVSSSASLINRKAPEIARRDLSGNALDLRSLRGKVVLLNFWATWCAPCQLEMPVFAHWQQQYGPQGLQVVGISMDDDAPPARKVVTKLKLNYPVAMGDAKLGERYGGVLGLPLTYLIDRNGVVRARFQGETAPSKIEKQLRLMLSQR